jgi:Zn finger protein HypA/HybF involved in hydrogenase expression
VLNRTRFGELVTPIMSGKSIQLARTVPRCAKCGGRRRRIGVVPHEEYANLRIDLYRCATCEDRSQEIVRNDQAELVA